MNQPQDKDPEQKIPESQGDGALVAADLPSEKLTAEQQMAQFEELLKEEDWGHQPC
jgi:hypothetical protein